MVSTLSQAARPYTCSGIPKKSKAEGCLQWDGPQCNGCCWNADTESEAIPKSRFLHSTEPVKNPEVVSAQTSLGEAVRSKETSAGTILQPHLDPLLRGGLGPSFPEPKTFLPPQCPTARNSTDGLEGNGKLISIRNRLSSDVHQPSYQKGQSSDQSWSTLSLLSAQYSSKGKKHFLIQAGRSQRCSGFSAGSCGWMLLWHGKEFNPDKSHRDQQNHENPKSHPVLCSQRS